MFPLGIRLWVNEKMVYSNQYNLDINRETKIGVISFIKNGLSYKSNKYMIMSNGDALNGNIYEYDIIHNIETNDTFIVYFDMTMGAFMGCNEKVQIRIKDNMQKYEVIGNVFETPELIPEIKEDKKDLIIQLSKITNQAKNQDLKDIAIAPINDIDIGLTAEDIKNRPIPNKKNKYSWKKATTEQCFSESIEEDIKKTPEEIYEAAEKEDTKSENKPADIESPKTNEKDKSIETDNSIDKEASAEINNDVKADSSPEEPEENIVETIEPEEPPAPKINVFSSDEPVPVEAMNEFLHGPQNSSITNDEPFVAETKVRYNPNDDAYIKDSKLNEELIQNATLTAEIPEADSVALLKDQASTVISFEQQEIFESEGYIIVYFEVYYDKETGSVRYNYEIKTELDFISTTTEIDNCDERRGALLGLIDILSLFVSEHRDIKLITSMQYITIPFNKGLLYQWAQNDWVKQTTNIKIKYAEEWQQVYNLFLNCEKLNMEFVPERLNCPSLISCFNNAKNNTTEAYLDEYAV